MNDIVDMTINKDPASEAVDKAAAGEAANKAAADEAANKAAAAAIAASGDLAGMTIHWIDGSKSLSHETGE